MEQQEQKYTAELDNALKEYAEQKEQAAEFNPDELMGEQLVIRPDKECSAVYPGTLTPETAAENTAAEENQTPRIGVII